MAPEPIRTAGELAHLLRLRRERLQPADVGLPEGARRRTRGLRREEVASLAAISPDYYTFLEQGRELRPSRDVLDALAGALLLSSAERTHLHELVHATPPPAGDAVTEEVSPVVAELVARQDPHPAYIKNRRWDVLAANRAATALFGGFGDGNVLRFMFTPAAREVYVDWEPQARAMLARFRMVAARHPGDARIAALADEVRAAGAEVDAWWDAHEVAPRTGGRKRLRHPQLGVFDLEHVVLQVGDDIDTKLVIFGGEAEDEPRLRALIDSH